MKKSAVALTIFFMTFGFNLYAQKSTIVGYVEDAANGEELVGVNISVNELTNVGTNTDNDGKFVLSLKPGSYSLKISYVGYTTIVKTDVVVLAGKETSLYIKMTQSSVQLNEITVHSDYFDKSTIVNNLATISLSPEEIRRSPGSDQDFQRILQGMPGVSFSSDQSNELLVRGGSPNENLTVLDEMELHSTNHYPNEYNSGGPINMVNVDLIEDIKFSTGGFISKYGDKLSSVMEITTREGTRNSGLLGDMNLSMAGFGGVFEGKINEGKGSWIFSIRKSYLDLVAGAVGLTAVPNYYDGQFKLVYDFSSSQKLSWSGIYGNDKINIHDDDEKTDYAKRNQVTELSVEYDNVKQYQYATGLTLKSIWSKNLYSKTTLYYNNYYDDVTADEHTIRRYFDNNGKVYNKEELRVRNLMTDNHHNAMLVLKSEWFKQLNTGNEISIGGSIGTGDFIQNLYIAGDSSRYFINGQWTNPIVVQPSSLEYNIKLFGNFKYYAFANDRIKMLDDRLVLNLGARYDYFSYSQQGNLSPRFSGSYFFIPGQTSFNFAYGEYYQTQNYPTYGDRENSDINRYLKNSHARHFVVGIEHIIDDGLKVDLEAYHKSYDDLPISEDFIHFDDKTFRSNKNLSVGKQTVNGIDLLIQQKLVKDIFGTISLSRMWTKYEDPRIGYEGKTMISDYDYPYVFTLVLGKRFKNLRTELMNSNIIIKYASYLLPFSDDMEISVRWHYASGRPYTERVWTSDIQNWENGNHWSEGAWTSVDAYNNKRYPDYHRLDLAFNSRFNFDKWSIELYLSIQNVYNRKNIAGYQYNSDGTMDTVYQFSLLPVIGLDVRF